MAKAKRAAKPKAQPKPKREKIAKSALTPVDPTRPIGKSNPSIEYQFKPGNQAGVGHGRPRKLKDLQALIIETLAEETGSLTRARLMVRQMLITSPSDRKTLLEYAFGKVPDVTKAKTWEDEVVDLLVEGKATEQLVRDELPEYAESLIARAHLRRHEDGAMEGEGTSTGE